MELRGFRFIDCDLWINQNSVEFHIFAELLQLKNERKLHID